MTGRTHLCRLEAQPLADADAWLAHYRRFWRDQFDALDAVLKVEDGEPKATPHLTEGSDDSG